ncbi:MAG: methionine--tRNA ligase subunit beta [Thermoprotei archaeon]|nr:MAG: methionine--tRNA ligase subunit beta [Thermoprotei archaeon]RLE98607.1 MAG: methionine--tRNA ligase subunit beta [Thermoprotei archaeon]
MGEVSFEEFKRLDLRVGRIVAAERVKRARKLLLLKVDLGGETRQLVAGLAEYYDPSELIGKEVVVVANLKPKVIMGLVSQGMLLAAVEDGKPVLIIPEREVPPGTRVE